MAQEKETNDSKGLVKSSAVVGGMTFISRISGFLRDVVFANIFGASAHTDAFFISFKIHEVAFVCLPCLRPQLLNSKVFRALVAF